MSLASDIDLQKIVLRFPRSKLRGTANTKISISCRHSLEGHNSVVEDVVSLEELWVRKGQSLTLAVEAMIDQEPIDLETREQVEKMLLEADMWKQLGLQALPHAGSGINDGQTRILLKFGTEEQPENDTPKEKPIYDLCYRTPAKDVAPPPGVPIADLDGIKISFFLSRVTQRKRAKKRRKTMEFEIFEDNDEEEMLLGSQSEKQVSETDAILAIIDATIRMNISGDSGRTGSIAEGLTAKTLDESTSLACIAPAVFSRFALQFMSTRAALLPTIAHALSSSLSTARSRKVKAKFQQLAPRGATEEEPVSENDKPATRRYEHAHRKLWTYLQHHLPRKNMIPRLKSLRDRNEQTTTIAEDDEDLFASVSQDLDAEDLSCFKSQELEDEWADDDDLVADPTSLPVQDREDDDLFALQQPERGCEINDALLGDEDLFEDLFEDLEEDNDASTPALRRSPDLPSPTAGTAADDLRLHGFHDDMDDLEDPDVFDDDLLLDLMMDDGMLEE